ncbi:hypothetical protein OBK28_13300 [Empedobacter falsenii]|uniref:Uncharacterized protein n=1 Tax=Empedobacter falsenii TaxID=343874 RepID=A0ABY8V4F3_9FLAO|nr:hypothetical protein [Empedobacter falsenii]WIH96545.1 hypothetical protein OBA43_09725 [Empedobacter falsenii]
MVTVINFIERTRKDGSSFFVLEVQGGLEMVKSEKTASFYATIKKAFIPSTFDENTCQAIIGTQIPGSIEKVETEPYEYTIKETGEVIKIKHKFEYNPEESLAIIPSQSELLVSGRTMFTGNANMAYA